MASTDYFNPSSMEPQIDFKPQGALAGYIYGQKMDDYAKFIKLQKQLMGNAASTSDINLENLRLDNPVKAAGRLADIATAQSTANTVGPMAQEKLSTEVLKNKKTAATQPSEIAASVAKSISEKSTAEQQDFMTRATGTLTKLQLIRDQVAKSLNPDQDLPAIAKSVGLDPSSPVVQQLVAKHKENPVSGITGTIDKMQETLMNSLEHLRTIQKTAVEVQGHKDVANITGQYSVQAAQEHAKATRYAADVSMQIHKMTTKLENDLSAANKALQGNTDPEKRPALQKNVDDIMYQMIAVKAAGAPITQAEVSAGLTGQSALNMIKDRLTSFDDQNRARSDPELAAAMQKYPIGSIQPKDGKQYVIKRVYKDSTGAIKIDAVPKQ